jgi:hypothetical protein
MHQLEELRIQRGLRPVFLVQAKCEFLQRISYTFDIRF